MRGVEAAAPPPEALDGDRATRARSSSARRTPCISIGPILAVPGMREALRGAPRAGRRRLAARRRRRREGPDRRRSWRWAGVALGADGRRRATTATCSTASSPTSAPATLPVAGDRHADGTTPRRAPPRRSRDARASREALRDARCGPSRSCPSSASAAPSSGSTRRARDGTRRALAEAMVTDVLIALRRATASTRCSSSPREPRRGALARGYGARRRRRPERARATRGRAARHRRARSSAARRACCSSPATARRSTPRERRRAARRATDGRVVVVPDRHGTGTNALLLTPPDAIEPAFGPGQLRAPRRPRAATAGVRVRRSPSVPSLGLDVDTPDDLAALRALAARTAAPRTRAGCSRRARPPL